MHSGSLNKNQGQYHSTNSSDTLQETQKTKRPDKIDDYKMDKFLGKGAYSDVYLYQNILNNKLSAIKTIDKIFLEKQHKQHHVYIERDVLQQLHHPGIIQLTSTFQTSQKLYFCLEYASQGDLSDYIKNNSPLSFVQIQFCTAQILVSIEYIHQNGIVHRDLKPENLLLTQEFHLKLTDFATAMVFDESKLSEERASRIRKAREKYSRSNKSTIDSLDDEFELCRSSSFVGTSEYLCPELIDFNVSGPASDLWALGCILYKMISGHTPFQDDSEYNMFQRITKEDIEISTEVNPQIADLLNILLNKNHSARFGSNFNKNQYNYDGLKNHPFFDGFNFKDIWCSDSPLKNTSRRSLPQLIYEIDTNNDDFTLTGKVDKENGFFVFTHFSPRILTLTVQKNIPYLSYTKPESDKQVYIPLNSSSKCRLLDQSGKFIVEDKNHVKYIFKEREQPAILWVQEINRIIKDF